MKSAYERYSEIRDKFHYKDSDVAKGANITKSTFSDWKAGRYTPKREKLQKIADFLGVSSDYIITGKETNDGDTIIESRDLRKKYQEIYDLLKSKETAPLYFDGQPADPDSIDLLLKQVEISFAILEKGKE